MRPADHPIRLAALGAILLLTGCGGDPAPDAYGNFEAIEVVVAAQTSGQVREFTPSEGMQLERDAVVALIDTTQLALEQRQLEAQSAAAGARRGEVGEQLEGLALQREIAGRTYERTRRLHAQQAATAAQLDQAERDYRTLGAQIEAARAQREGVRLDQTATAARVDRIRDQIAKSSVANPQAGTVLATYVRAGEIVQPGQPLYRIAGLDTLEVRAYVTGAQLASVRIGGRAEVRVDHGDGALLTAPGTVTWISPSAEFTPTPIQTRDERADLVYAVKLRVPNPEGAFKIGMPADVTFTADAP
jgi:HlyD family secretion protein